jgi:hypothetical protein
MAFSNLTRIILYVVAGISILVILFFYIGPKTVDYDGLELRVEEAMNPVDMSPVAPLPTVDSTEVDSTAQDSTAMGAMAQAEDQSAYAVESVAETPDVNLKEVMSGWEYLVWYRTDIALIWAYILILLTMIASIVFPLIAVFSNPKGLIRLVAVLVGAAVLVVISYLLASDAPVSIIGYTGTDNSDPATLKMIDTVLFVTYMLFGLALASILYAVTSRAFK